MQTKREKATELTEDTEVESFPLGVLCVLCG